MLSTSGQSSQIYQKLKRQAKALQYDGLAKGSFVELSDLFQCDFRPTFQPNSPPVTLLALIREAGGSCGPEDREACRVVEAAFSVSRRKHGWTSKQL